MLCRFTVIFFFLFKSINAFAQPIPVSAVVVGAQNSPIPGATLRLISHVDSAFVYGTTADESGQFYLTAGSGRYMIFVSMLGFRSQQIQLDLSGKASVQLDTIRLSEDAHQLQEAVVTQRRSAVQFEAGKTIVTPDLSILAGQGDVLTVLKNTPGLFATEDGGITLNGQSGVNIRVNGKDTYLTGAALANFLKSLPAGSVESIEIISSPSSAYDAAGKAGVINIKLKKRASEGFTINGRGNFQQSRHSRSDWGLRATMGKRRAGFGFDYAGADSDRLKQGSLDRTLEMGALNHHARQAIILRNQDVVHGLKVFSDFELSKRFSLEAYAGRNFYQRKIPGQSTTSFASKSTDSLLHTSSFSKYRQVTNTLGIQSAYRDEKQRELVVAADYFSFRHRESLKMSSETDYLGRTDFPPDTLEGHFGDRIQAVAAQADWQSPLTKHFKLQTGLKTANVLINNHAIYADVRHGEIQITSAQSVRYRYAESTSAAYVQVSGNAKKWSYVVGVRVESTGIHGDIFQLASQADSSYKWKYTRLFPSVNIQYKFSEEQQLAVSYNHRITRPNYRDLSPSGYIVDRYVMVNGNPSLLPELTRIAEVTYLAGASWRSSLYYNTNSQTIAQVFRARAGGGLLITPENLSSRKTFGIKLDGADILPLKWWQLGVNMSISGVSNQWTEEGVSSDSRKIVPMAHVSNGWTIGAGWSAELTGYYNGKMPLGQIELPAVWSVSAGIRKKLVDGRLVVRLYGTDLLASIRERSVFRNQYVSGKADLRYEETYIGLSLQYTFKRGQQKELKEKSNEEKMRINF